MRGPPLGPQHMNHGPHHGGNPHRGRGREG